MISYCILIGLSAAVLIGPYLWHLRHIHEWHRAPNDGLMQRRVRGKWEYREMTEGERLELLEFQAW